MSILNGFFDTLEWLSTSDNSSVIWYCVACVAFGYIISKTASK